jgi:hypothetical protein
MRLPRNEKLSWHAPADSFKKTRALGRWQKHRFGNQVARSCGTEFPDLRLQARRRPRLLLRAHVRPFPILDGPMLNLPHRSRIGVRLLCLFIRVALS